METTEIISIMPNPGLASTFLVFLVHLHVRLFRTDVTHVLMFVNTTLNPSWDPQSLVNHNQALSVVTKL